MEDATLSGVMTIFASFISDFWNDQIVAHEGEGLFFVLIGFLGSFGFIRMSTRLIRSPRVSWWPGSVVSDSGVHLHHLVFGIWLMIGPAPSVSGSSAKTLGSRSALSRSASERDSPSTSLRSGYTSTTST